MKSKADGSKAAEVVNSLKRLGSPEAKEQMKRYGTYTEKAFGVPVSQMQAIAKKLGRDHQLALDLWETGWYEARMVAAFVDEPERVTAAQMDRWCRDFDNWGICDTVCFHLFDRTPHAFGKVDQWAGRKEEFVKRGAFALLACLALHDKQAADKQFMDRLPLIEQAATDERNFVKKGVSWALRLIGRRNPELHGAALALSERLAASANPAAKWIGKDAVKDLSSAAAKKMVTRKV